MSQYLSHEENRKKVCVVCDKKIIFGQQKLSSFSVTKSIATSIQNHVNSNYSLQSDKYPLSICGTCRLTLVEYGKDVRKRPLPSMPNYEDIVPCKQTRCSDNEEVPCQCYICLTARLSSHKKVNLGRGHIRQNINKQIDKSNGVYGAGSSKTINNVKNDKNENKELSLSLCPLCFQKIGRGINHDCPSKYNNKDINVAVAKNISKVLMTQLPEKQQLQIAHSILKNKIESKENSSSKNSELSLNTAGKSKKITFGKQKQNKVNFSAESLDNFQNNTGSTMRHMSKLTNFIRSNAGRKSVPTDYLKHASQQSKTLEDCYETGEFDFDVVKNKIKMKQKRPVVWANSENLLESVIDQQKLVGNYEIKVMADGGQGFFKICMSILPENCDSESDEENNFGPVKKRRSSYATGGTVGRKAKETSVNRLVLLCVVTNILETYENIQKLFELIDINAISFKFVSDFKVPLIVNGQQTATSTCPCPYCFVTLNDLRNTVETEDESNKNNILKTYGNIKDDYNQFCAMGKNLKNAKECHSTVHLPLFKEDDHITVISKCIVPELHILQGFVNHVFWDVLVPFLGREIAILWPLKLNLIPKNYQGELFEGNACRKLLKEADKLLDPDIYSNVGELRLLPFVNVFKAMNKIVECSFSTKYVDLNLNSRIAELDRALKAVPEISETLKMHVLRKHTKQCLDNLKGRGLGFWSEQAGESVHKLFLLHWDRYKINSTNNSAYLVHLKKAVVEFSSRHI